MRIEPGGYGEAWTGRARAESCDVHGGSSRRALVRLRRHCWAIHLLVVIFLGTLTIYAHGSRNGNSVEGQGTPPAAAGPGPIVVQNAYYPKPGLEE
jgi:hypothetical protein